MQRRAFIEMAGASALSLAAGASSVLVPGRAFADLASQPVIPDTEIKRVLAMFKCHFDAGFIDTQANVVRWYFNEYFPQAITFAERSRQPGGHRYVWTTGSWLLYEYLEQASADDRKRMEEAIAQGDVAWHAIPLTWQSEMMDQSMIAASIGLSHSLDRRFGRTTTGAKLTDVPGHTLGLIAPLAAEGVKFLDVGGNGACARPEVPLIFVWKDPSGASIVVIHEPGYGGITRVPGSDLAISVNVRGDNSGPHPPGEVAEIYADLRRRFPNAEIVATDLTEIANAIEPYRSNLPTVTQEIGDTWIYGVSSDPLKTARYREVARLRQSWIAQGKIKSGDATDTAFLRSFLLEIEHTWGADTKSWIDFDHYTPRDLAPVLGARHYKVMEFSWEEKRQDLFDGIATLPQPLREEALAAVRALAPTPPQLQGATHHAAEKEIDTAHFVFGLDPRTGAIHRLRNKHTGIEWASVDHPLALLSYQTLDQADYFGYLTKYSRLGPKPLEKDLGKPNIECFGAKHQEWQPTLTSLEMVQDVKGHHLLAHLELRDPKAVRSGRAAFPRKLYLQYTLPAAEPVVHIELSLFQKPATRMPETFWLTFNPMVPNPRGWTIDKSGIQMSPLDVVAGGGRHQHAVATGFGYRNGDHVLDVECIDAPLIAVGEKSPINFSRSQPDLSSGIHCSLCNNAWGTNYIMWYGEDMRFRFRISA